MNRDQTLDRYFARARRFPLLTVDQENDLVRRWQEADDRNALSQLIGSHLRLVIRIARDHQGYGLPLADLISEGHVGLMQAVAKFDTQHGARFATYAMWWIRAAMREYILRSWSLVRLGTTASQKKLFFNLRRVKSDLQVLGEGDLTPESASEVGTRLDVQQSDVIEMNRRLSGGDLSLNSVVSEETGDEWLTLLPDETLDLEFDLADADELAWRRMLLKENLFVLNARERDILLERRMKEEPLTLEDLSQRYGISRERVRQIENRAFDKLRASMIEAAGSRPAN